MNYFFDESGNWAEPLKENNLLVLGGLLIKDKSLERNLSNDIRFFRDDNNLQTLHANELNNQQRDELYGIIDRYLLSDNMTALVRCFSPNIFYKKTIENIDNVYIDLASVLINDISFGDNIVNIEYDMKFNYSYPANVVSKLYKKLPYYYHKTILNFDITEKGYTFSRKRISDIIERNLEKEKNDMLNRFYQKINHTSEKQAESRKQNISNYLWTELYLKIESNETMRSKFKDKIEFNSENRMKTLGIKSSKQQFMLTFSTKHKQSVGVQIIDILSNMIYRFGIKPNKKAPSSVQGIYKNITLQEVL